MKNLIMTLTFVFALGACSSVKIEERNTTIVTAKNVTREQGATGITDHFTFEEKIFAAAALKWDTDKSGGRQTIEAKWYNGERLVSRTSQTFNMNNPPFYAWFSTLWASLGVGKCRVEMYANDNYIGSKTFTISEK